jgi:hypothetical protein
MVVVDRGIDLIEEVFSTELHQKLSNAPSIIERELLGMLEELSKKQIVDQYRSAIQWQDTVKECLEFFQTKLEDKELAKEERQEALEQVPTWEEQLEKALSETQFIETLVPKESLGYVKGGEINDSVEVDLEHRREKAKWHEHQMAGRYHDPLKDSTSTEWDGTAVDLPAWKSVLYPVTYKRNDEFIPNIRVLLKPMKNWKNRNIPEILEVADNWQPKKIMGKPFTVPSGTVTVKSPIKRDKNTVLLELRPSRISESGQLEDNPGCDARLTPWQYWTMARRMWAKSPHIRASYESKIALVNSLIESVPMFSRNDSELEAKFTDLGFDVIWKGMDTIAEQDNRKIKTVKQFKTIDWVTFGGLPIMAMNGWEYGSAQIGAPKGLEYERRNKTQKLKYSFGGMSAKSLKDRFVSMLAIGQVNRCRYHDNIGKWRNKQAGIKNSQWGKSQAWVILDVRLKDQRTVKCVVFCDLSWARFK